MNIRLFLIGVVLGAWLAYVLSQRPQPDNTPPSRKVIDVDFREDVPA